MKQSEILSIISGHRTLPAVIKNHCGELIGEGVHRDVYILKHDDKWVVKIERDMSAGNFTNAMEWRNYVNHKDYIGFGEYLAPIIAINETGQFMIQRRAERVIDGCKKHFPTHIPNWFTDTKKANFGWIGKQFVCFDYPFLIAPAFRMKKAKYW